MDTIKGKVGQRWGAHTPGESLVRVPSDAANVRGRKRRRHEMHGSDEWGSRRGMSIPMKGERRTDRARESTGGIGSHKCQPGSYGLTI